MPKLVHDSDLGRYRWQVPAGHCDFRRFVPMERWRFQIETGRKRRRARCPQCGRRLTLRTVVEHWPGHGILGYEIPDHKA